MKEHRLQKLLLIIVMSSFLLLQVPPPGASQGYEGKVISESDDEMIGLSEYSGGGHMTVTITGEQATALRRRIIYMFDERSSIPAGFTGTNFPSWSSTHNGVLDEQEILQYSLWVQRYLWERQGQGGTPYYFSRMTKVELLDGDTAAGVPLSTEGLLGTDVDTDASIVIKHIFNLESGAQHRTFDLSDNLTVSALYEGFSFHRSHDFNDTFFGPFSVGGEPATINWIIKDNPYYPGNPALWHGSSDTPEYDHRITASTYADFDLRFAVEAAMRFSYVGRVESGDTLRIQIKEEGESSYTNLQTLGFNDNWDTFQTLVFDLDSYIGKKVRVNFNFTSNQSQNNTGFFIDDFDINAPCAYIGTLELHNTDYIVGALSFAGFEKDQGTAHLIRTPAGMILTYSSSFNSTNPPADRAVFTTFDFLDNPQILFGLIFVCAYLMSHFQNKYYNDYRRAYSMAHREGWFKRKWLHGLGLLGIILFILFYFFPSLFVLAGANFYMLGVFMWAFCIVYLVVMVIVTKFVYIKAEEAIPPPIPREDEISVVVEAPEEYVELPPPVGMAMAVPCSVCLEDLHDIADEGIKCKCGQVFHKDCAEKAERCPNCNRLLEVVKPKETRMVSVKCPSCGDTVLVEGDSDLLRTHCESCGSILQEIALGYNYLIVDDNPAVAFEEFNSILKKEVPSLCISTTFPDKLRKEYDVQDTDLFWLSDTATDPSVKTLDPKRLDFELMRAISNFFKDSPKGVVIIDGIEYLTVENGFERVLRFVKKINDLASVSDATVIVPVGPSALGKDEFAMLKKEFDKVQVLTSTPLPE